MLLHVESTLMVSHWLSTTMFHRILTHSSTASDVLGVLAVMVKLGVWSPRTMHLRWGKSLQRTISMFKRQTHLICQMVLGVIQSKSKMILERMLTSMVSLASVSVQERNNLVHLCKLLHGSSSISDVMLLPLETFDLKATQPLLPFTAASWDWQ